MLLSITDGTVSRNGQTVLSHFHFEIRGTEKIAIVGRNGAGKTTLLDVISGRLPLDRDDRRQGRGENAGIATARSFTTGMVTQQVDLDPEQTAGEMMHEISGEDRDLETACSRMFTNFGFSMSDRDRRIGECSGGEQKKLQLICQLIRRPEVLILDEPTNHLDLDAVQWLEHYIRAYPNAVVMVSHDRFFMDETAEVTWEVLDGKLYRYAGGYSAYRQEKQKSLEQQEKQYERQQEEIRREEALIKRFHSNAKKASFARSRKKMLERMELITKPKRDDAVIHRGDILPEHPGPKWVLQCELLQIGYGKHLVREVDFRIRRGQKIGVIGPNGSGKSTFLKTVAGVIPKLSGKCTLGNHVDLAYFDQDSARISSEKTVMDYFHDAFPSRTEKEVRKSLSEVLFFGRDVEKRVSSLSGGEKARLVLAVLMERRPNFLVLDEPTNNMDIPARETMESLFRSYRGTILFVSHDRYFIGQVADSLLVFDYEGRSARQEDGVPGIRYFPMDYRHYLRQQELERQGLDMAALRTAEDEKLVEELKAVPKRTAMQARPRTTQEETLDWYFEQNKQERQKAEETIEQISTGNQKDGASQSPDYMTLEEYMNSDDTEDPEQAAKEKEAEDALTESLIDWYDLWLETPEGRNQK